jgi:hypothetical protein
MPLKGEAGFFCALPATAEKNFRIRSCAGVVIFVYNSEVWGSEKQELI